MRELAEKTGDAIEIETVRDFVTERVRLALAARLGLVDAPRLVLEEPAAGGGAAVYAGPRTQFLHNRVVRPILRGDHMPANSIYTTAYESVEDRLFDGAAVVTRAAVSALTAVIAPVPMAPAGAGVGAGAVQAANDANGDLASRTYMRRAVRLSVTIWQRLLERFCRGAIGPSGNADAARNASLRLRSFTSWVLSHVFVFLHTTTTIARSFSVYRDLNSRGIHMAPSDGVKAAMIGIASSHPLLLPRVRSVWQRVQDLDKIAISLMMSGGQRELRCQERVLGLCRSAIELLQNPGINDQAAGVFKRTKSFVLPAQAEADDDIYTDFLLNATAGVGAAASAAAGAGTATAAGAEAGAPTQLLIGDAPSRLDLYLKHLMEPSVLLLEVAVASSVRDPVAFCRNTFTWGQLLPPAVGGEGEGEDNDGAAAGAGAAPVAVEEGADALANALAALCARMRLLVLLLQSSASGTLRSAIDGGALHHDSIQSVGMVGAIVSIIRNGLTMPQLLPGMCGTAGIRGELAAVFSSMSASLARMELCVAGEVILQANPRKGTQAKMVYNMSKACNWLAHDVTQHAYPDIFNGQYRIFLKKMMDTLWQSSDAITYSYDFHALGSMGNSQAMTNVKWMLCRTELAQRAGRIVAAGGLAGAPAPAAQWTYDPWAPFGQQLLSSTPTALGAGAGGGQLPGLLEPAQYELHHIHPTSLVPGYPSATPASQISISALGGPA